MKKFIYGALFLALVGITLVSCEKRDVFEESDKQTELLNLRNATSETPVFDYSLIEGVENNYEKSEVVLSFFQDYYNTEFVSFNSRIHTLLDNSPEENFSIAIELGVLSTNDLIEIKNLCKAIGIEGGSAVSDFKQSNYYLNLDEDSQEVLEGIVEILENDILEGEKKSEECAWAIAAFVAASVALASITAATGGLAVAATIAGYNIACVQLVQACKK